MSNIDHNIPTSELIPIVESSAWVFDGRETSRFAVAKIAIGETVLPGFDEVHHGYMMLRGRVYADKTRMIDRSKLNADGSEKPDVDDSRSVHFAVLENMGSAQRIVGTTRHIVQDMFHPAPLPIANFFPDFRQEFELDAGVRPFEVSRWIQAHESKGVQAYLARPLLRHTLIDALAFERIPSFCTVEEPVAQRLQALSIDIAQVAKPIFVPEYDDVNAGYEIDLTKTAANYAVDDAEVQAARENPSQIHYFGKLAAIA